MLHTANMLCFYFVLVWMIILIISCQLPPADRRRCENSHRSSCSVSHTRQHTNTFSAMVFTALHYGIHLQNSTASSLSHIQYTQNKNKNYAGDALDPARNTAQRGQAAGSCSLLAMHIWTRPSPTHIAPHQPCAGVVA